MNFDLVWRQALARKRAQNLERHPNVIQSPQGVRIQIASKAYLNFSSNDYLGLAADERVVDAFKAGAMQWGVGAGASHLISGHTHAHQDLEARLAELTGRESAILFSSGYMANLGIVQSLSSRHGWIGADRLNHASLVDAVRLCQSKSLRYAHADASHLRSQLAEKSGSLGVGATGACPGLILTDGVFSMDGDLAPLRGLSEIAADYNACLVVDDAHGFGVLGNGFGGTPDALSMTTQDIPVYMATLGKAVGVAGAFVAGSHALVRYLRQFARPYAYTTALPAACAVAALAALDIMEREPWRRQKALEVAAYFRDRARQKGFRLISSETCIQCLVVGDCEVALAMAEGLKQLGFWVPAIRPPTVPEGSARLRFSFTPLHQIEDVDALLRALLLVSPDAMPA